TTARAIAHRMYNGPMMLESQGGDRGVGSSDLYEGARFRCSGSRETSDGTLNSHQFSYTHYGIAHADLEAGRAAGVVRDATPGTGQEALAALAPAVSIWFAAAFGTPTAAQRSAWPALARGENLLLAAPTGSGKTLAAFAPVFSGLLEEGS